MNGESDKVKGPGKLSAAFNKIKGRAERLIKHLHLWRIIQLRIYDALGDDISHY